MKTGKYVLVPHEKATGGHKIGNGRTIRKIYIVRTISTLVSGCK